MKKNVIVGQSGGPTAVINASLAGVYKTAKDMGADTIYGMRYGIQGLLEKKIVDLGEKIRNDMDVELLKRTPASFLGSCRYKLPEISEDKAIYEKIFAILEELEIMAFFYIGGNDSMDTIKKLSDYAETVGNPIRFIGVPKTIDNDLEGTDHTPGYGSAAKYIATVTKELVRDGVEIHSLWARRHGTKFNGAPYIVQRAGEAVYSPEGKAQLKEQIAYYMRNAKTILDGLSAAGFSVSGGKNAPYIWLKTPDQMTSWEFFDYLLEKAHIVGTPGSGFGAHGEGYFRLTAFGSYENTLEAIERIKNL